MDNKTNKLSRLQKIIAALKDEVTVTKFFIWYKVITSIISMLFLFYTINKNEMKYSVVLLLITMFCCMSLNAALIRYKMLTTLIDIFSISKNKENKVNKVNTIGKHK